MRASVARRIAIRRRIAKCVLIAIWAFLVLPPFSPLSAQPGDSHFHPEFRPESGEQLSPPVVYKPIYECAEAVHVMGFIPHAHVRVFANGTELVGELVDPPFAFTEKPIPLSRPLKFGEQVTATQTIDGLTSNPSIHPVVVEHRPTFPTGLPMPKVVPPIYECGRIVPVDDMVESVRVKLFDEGTSEIGNEAVAAKWQPVWSKPLTKDHDVTAQLFACEHDPAMALSGPMSSPVKVLAVPSIPLPSAVVRQSELIVGNDVATIDGLLVGSHVTVLDRGTPIGDGYATAGANWVPLKKRIESASQVQAVQELCSLTSPPLPPVPPTDKLPAPLVVVPICAGQQYVIVRNTVVNATVVVFRNGGIAAYGGAGAGDVILGLGGGAKFNAGDKVVARQYMGSLLSPPSPTVTVDGRIPTPSLEIVDGEPFFTSEGEEQAIDGPVFPRGRTPGPLFLVHSCCNENVKLRIEREGGGAVADVPLTEVFPGYYSARWDWRSLSGWPVPGGIPVGRYFAIVTTSCAEEPATKPFYVIFNPAAVGGPDRFSFNETGVWFGTGSDSSFGMLYHLHADDRRVFELALNAAQGTTESADAAQRIVDLEESLFAYDLGWHGNDVIHMIENEHEAQCADDANVLTALLRAMGIPAHPATADAALETNEAHWTFDTWTEFLADHGGGPEWRIFHPHEYPDMAAETRGAFGTRGVANKGFNDLIIMADVNWKWDEAGDGAADVNFGRPDCNEPEQFPLRKIWVRDLCEEGYWFPNHWSCGAMRMSASGLNVEVVPAAERLDWGGKLTGTLRVSNATDADFEDDVLLEIVADLPESMKFPDEVLQTQRLPMKIGARGVRVERFELDVPNSNPAGTLLYLRARMGDSTIFVRPLEVRPRLDVRVDGPQRLRVGEKAVLKIIVGGTDRERLSNLRLEVSGPRGIQLSENASRRIDTLRASERSTSEVEITPQSPLEAGQIIIDVETAEGGSRRILRPITVEGDEPKPQPVPAFREE